MANLKRSVRSAVRQGNLIAAVVRDVTGPLASVQLSTRGTIYHNLHVTGGPLYIGQQVYLDYTTNPPTVIAPGKDFSSDIDSLRKTTQTQRRTSSGKSAPVASSWGWSVVIPMALGIAGYIEVPFSVRLTEVALVGDVSGDCVIDIWTDVFDNFPPTDAGSIVIAGVAPTLDGAISYKDNALTGWSVDLPAGNWLAFNVDSYTTVAQVTLSMKGTRV